jgi:hemolysin D
MSRVLEREFLPAALELVETPAPALPRAVMLAIVAALAFAIGWSFLGRIDVVAVAPGKVIAADKTKIIQPAEVGVVKRILVADGQTVRAGDVLIELEAAATATAADTARQREALLAAQLEAARYEALSRDGPLKAPAGAPKALVEAEARAMASQQREQRAKLAELDAEIARKSAELGAVKELANKLEETLPIAEKRAADYRSLVERKFVSQHGYLEREQVRIENEHDLAFQRARLEQLAAGVEESRRHRESLAAEFERGAVNAKVEADKRAAMLVQDLVKAQTRQRQQTLVSPVDGVVQQLGVHTVGGVVTPAQALMVITPNEVLPEVEALLENRDVGFVKAGQHVEVKVETFPFTRYGTVPGTVTFVSRDAIVDEKRGLVFLARVKLDPSSAIPVTPGMAVTAEIATDRRRVIDFFLDPIRRTASEALIER